MRRVLSRLARDRKGVTVVEFALISPVMIVLIMGFTELLYQGYLQASLTGLAQAAGRNGTIQGASASTIDAALLSNMRAINANVGFASGYPKRQSYHEFGDIAPEPFVDGNANGLRDPGECFTDLNGNAQWDADPGSTSQGGASDVVVYTVNMTYPRILPVTGWLGWSGTATISTSTILKSQPYASQPKATEQTVCT